MSKLKHIQSLLLALLSVALLAAGCQQEKQETLRVFLTVGANEPAIITLAQPVTVRELLAQENIELGEDDRVEPSENVTVTDGLNVTVVRVVRDVECEEVSIPFSQQVLLNEAMAPNETRLAQEGREGIRQTCYQVEYVNGVEDLSKRTLVRDVELQEAVDEIVWQGVSPPPPVAIEGTLAYISNGRAWMIRGNSSTKKQLTTESGLDGRVFDLSPDGRQLVYTRLVEDDEQYFNSLWVIMNTREREPEEHELIPDNVLYGEWVPEADQMIAYSTSDMRPEPPGWEAHNNLWWIQLDADAEILQAIEVLGESSGGLFGWWGTTFSWAPDGLQVAWARADGVGMVNLDARTFEPLFEFSIYNTYRDWAWVPTLSWSPGSDLLLTTVHAPSLSGDNPEDSPIFDVAVASPDGRLVIDGLVQSAGLWAAPQFSPIVTRSDGNQYGYIAYLQARGAGATGLTSSAYDLVVIDRDGSNPRVLFPESSSDLGLQPQDVAWSPDARHIAFVYQSTLWIVEVETGIAQQITADDASDPCWVE
jgi:hypothetical protein